jgi:3-phosphoshikimate 1-carboxyvinyltransferase
LARWIIEPSLLQGAAIPPPSKSHTLRAILFGLLAEGESEVVDPLPSPDTEAMLRAISLVGGSYRREGNRLWIQGGELSAAPDVIDCGNSGQVLRFMGAVAGLIPAYTVFTGDESIRTRRPAAALVDGLTQLGAFAVSTRGNGYAPLVIRGAIRGERAEIDGEDSQPVSGLLMAAVRAPHPIEISVRNPKETPWIGLTLQWLKERGVRVEREGFSRFRVEPRAIAPFHYQVARDYSSAAFVLAAGLIAGRAVAVEGLDPADAQGDKRVVEWMGGRMRVERGLFRGGTFDLDEAIDALPVMAALGCYGEAETVLYNGAIARKKESDRIRAMAVELQKMGGDIEEREEGLRIRPRPLKGARLFSHHDHRVALALAVAALGAAGESEIDGVECVEKSFPGFMEELSRLGAKIRCVGS